MAITYTWEITSLKTKTEGSNTDAVVQTYWKKTGTDDAGNVGSFSGATPLTSSGVASFTAFTDLTETNVIDWIKAVVIEDYETHVNAQIQKQIDEAVTPVTEKNMPWA
jgi:hypothetical protein|tara:strand:+ start:139 stop:462 length:324 start_codon:yes stop_codon:yes gene_type:complete